MNERKCAHVTFQRFRSMLLCCPEIQEHNVHECARHLTSWLSLKMQPLNISTPTEQVTVVRGKSDGINASLCERRERIEELNGTRSLLRKVQVHFKRTLVCRYVIVKLEKSF